MQYVIYLEIKADGRLQALKRLQVCVYHGKNELSTAGRIRIVPTLREKPGDITECVEKKKEVK